MWRRASLIILLQLLLICAKTNAFAGGAGGASCLTLTPNHQGLSAQPTEMPATVSFESSVSLHRNQLLNLTITAHDMRTFNGFTIQARRMDIQNVEESIVGTFELTEGMRHVNCPNFPQATATHTSNTPKQVVRLTWRAPATFPGGSDRILVRFHFSIVESFAIFWTNSQSNPLLIENFEHAEHPQVPPGPLSPYTGCGTTKKCFGYPANCIATENCEIFVGVFVDNLRFVFELFATPIDSSQLSYVAFGLSADSRMHRSSVIECVNENGVVRAFTSFAVAEGANFGSPRLPQDRQSIISLRQGSLVDGGIHCLVERDTVTIVNDMTFDLNQNHFLLLAKGNFLFPGSIGPHLSHRVASDRAYSLVVQDDVEEFPSPYEGCGSTKTCFGFPNNCINSQNCEMFGGVFVDNGVFVFELFAVPTDATSTLAYTSFALSDDNRMPRSSVIECVNQNNNIRAFTSFTGTETSPRLPPNEQGIIRLRRGQLNDGRIHCFVERNTLTTVGQMTFDLNQRHFLLLAKGNSKTPTSIGPHKRHRAYSDRAYLLTGGEVVRAAGARPLTMAHGSIMAIAWIGCATMGIFIAKYFKNTWSESSICGTAVWFFWHLLFQILTWALTISAIIIIFVDVGEWRTTTHSILGIIVMSLAVVHPIGALFRPTPSSRARPIFNFMHGNFGFIIHFLAFFTIYFAVRLPAADLVYWTIYIIIAFVAFYAIMHIVFGMIEVFSQIKKNDRLAKNVVKNAEPYPLLKKTLLGFLALTVFLFTVAMVLLVTLPSPE